MALKPVINIENTIFDATQDFVVEFTWTGNQVYKNRILIINNKTGETIEEINDGTKNHIIKAGILENGNVYTVQIQVFDVNDNPSELSDKVRLKAITTPEFSFNNIPDDDKIEASNYTFVVSYKQVENELLKEYRFYLYNSSGDIINISDMLYSTSTETSVDLEYTIKGLENNKIYYIECIGKTVNGFDINTKREKIEIKYVVPPIFSLFEAECDTLNGYIKYNTNIIIVSYNGKEDLKIVDGMVDLTNNNLYYDKGFDISGDFVLGVKFGKLKLYGNILEINNVIDSISLDYYTYGDEVRFKLSATNAIDKYLLYSEALQITNTDLITVWIKRVGNYYDLNVIIENNIFNE